MLEMTLVGIPIIFILISIFEMSRGMWMYHTAAHSVKLGVRIATTHGENCVYNPPSTTNSCSVTPSDLINGFTIGSTHIDGIRAAAVGLDPNTTKLTFFTLTSFAPYE